MTKIKRYCQDTRCQQDLDLLFSPDGKRWYLRDTLTNGLAANVAIDQDLIKQLQQKKEYLFTELRTELGFPQITYLIAHLLVAGFICVDKNEWIIDSEIPFSDDSYEDIEEQVEPEEMLIDDHNYAGYVVTCSLAGLYINVPFYSNLRTFCEIHNYKLVILPIKKGVEKEQLIESFVLSGSFTAWDAVYVNADLNLNANSQTPLSGLAGIAGDKHLVIPHPVIYQETTASPKSIDTRIITTTGTISDLRDFEPNNRVSSMTKFHASNSAIVIKKGHYPITYIHWSNRQQSFEYEGLVYRDNSYFKVSSPYVYMPDLHLDHASPEYIQALIADIRLNNGQVAIGGDVFNGTSMLHHEVHNLGYFANRPTIFEEVDKTLYYLNQIKNAGCKIKLIHGNHEDFTNKTLTKLMGNLTSFTKDEQVFLFRAMAWCLEQSKLTNAGIEYKSIFEYIHANTKLAELSELVTDVIKYEDILLNYHGNEYLLNRSGARASNFKIVRGHVHAPEIWRNLTSVGYGGVTPAYQSGLTRACAAHCVITSNGKRSQRIWLPKVI